MTLAALLLLVLSRSAYGGSASMHVEDESSGPLDDIRYDRTQTVTLQAPAQADIYATAYTATFQIDIERYVLGSYIALPPATVTETAWCAADDPEEACEIIWGTDVVTFGLEGTGRGHIYLEYDTSSRATRDPGSGTVFLAYPVGPYDLYQISLTNTVHYSRSLDPPWVVTSITPTETISDAGSSMVQWILPSTARRTFELTLNEPWLGCDLVVEQLDMSNSHPMPGEPVVYTLTVRNDGPVATGRPVLAEVLVRPVDWGTPVELDDHRGGWGTYGEDALFKWLDQPDNQDRSQVPMSEYWWPGLESGEVITGVTEFYWPQEMCVQNLCQVWARLDPAYDDPDLAYEWYGYNPEGYVCEYGVDGLPLCVEETNNIVSYYDFDAIYLPFVTNTR